MTTERRLALPAEARLAGLRSRLVSRLTGLSVHRLRYWHESGLLQATLRVGQRGVPRLYSWVDYLRMQLASQLDTQGVHTRRIREAIEFLDENFEEWYLLPDPLHADDRKHVLARVVPGESPLLADRHGQHVLVWPEDLRELAGPTKRGLELIAARGPLCTLSRFGDAVSMSPTINLAQPSILGTALETRFVAEMAYDIGSDEVAVTYRLSRKAVRRAIHFEEAVA